MNRRQLTYAGVAVAAGGIGMGAALWRTRSAAEGPPWNLRFDQPGGGQIRLADFHGQPLLLNFWATWCPPCVSEMPMLDKFQADAAAQGWRVAGLAVDNLAPVQAFLAKRPVRYPIGLAGTGGIELARSLGNSGGALPFSVVFDRRGDVVQRKLGVLTEADLQAWVHQLG